MHIVILFLWFIELGFYVCHWCIGSDVHPGFCVLMCGTGIFGCLECISLHRAADTASRTNSVAYICDCKDCEDGCINSECHHTCNIEHAKNFIRVGNGKWMEVEE